MRTAGLGGEVVKAAGTTSVIHLAGPDIGPALHSGAIDATEWVGPYNDLAFGLYPAPSTTTIRDSHEPAAILDNFIGLETWDRPGIEPQAIVALGQLARQRLRAERVHG